MGRLDYIFSQFRETTRCRGVQHGDGVCCAFAPQLVYILYWILTVIRRQTLLSSHLVPSPQESSAIFGELTYLNTHRQYRHT